MVANVRILDLKSCRDFKMAQQSELVVLIDCCIINEDTADVAPRWTFLHVQKTLRVIQKNGREGGT